MDRIALALGMVVALTSTSGNFKGPAADVIVLRDLPLIKQLASHTCGAAALGSVLGYYGFRYEEPVLAKLLGSDPQSGTDHKVMADFARKLGLKVEIETGQSIASLKAHLAKRQPVIVAFQAWPADEVKGPPLPYPETWDHGHYAVVIGVDEGHVYFADPSLNGPRGYLTHKEFMERWHDTDGPLYYQLALYFEGKPNPLPEWVRIP